MTELKGIKLEDLNVTKETFIKLIGLLNLDLELLDDERIIFEEEIEKFESGQVIVFYHLLVYGDKLYNFCLSFFSSSLSGNSFYLSGYNVDTCDSKQYLLDCLYKSGVLTPVEEENTSEPEQPAEELEDNQADELTPLELAVFEEIENCYERYNEYAELAKVAEYGAEYNGESAEEIVRYGHLANEQIFNSDYLKELISKAGLDETYQAWLKERREREAVGEAK